MVKKNDFAVIWYFAVVGETWFNVVRPTYDVLGIIIIQ